MNKIPKCYQLVGVPGSGKTTWAESQDWAHIAAHVSTDKWVENYAKEVGKTYSEVFENFMPNALKLMLKEIKVAREISRDVIFDQTSTSIKSRKMKFVLLPNYYHIAVVFKTPDPEELVRRLSSRPGKIIPNHVVDHMIKFFEMPTEAEGFKEIWYAN